MKHLIHPFRLLAILCLLALPAAALALEPDQIVILVNKNVPAGHELAEFYVQQRHLPDGRICELDLGADDNLSFDDYERKVVPAVREFLRKNHLEKKVTCLLSFYGVPLHIANRVDSPADLEEIKSLGAQLQALEERVRPAVEGLEQLADASAAEKGAGKDSQPKDQGAAPPGAGAPDRAAIQPTAQELTEKLQLLAQRADRAMARIRQAASLLSDADKKKELDEKFEAVAGSLIGPMNRIEQQLQEAAIIGRGHIAADSPAGQAVEKLVAYQARLEQLYERRFDPEARAQALKLIRENMGAFDLARAINLHLEYLATDQTGASLENELALLWWGMYPRSKWLGNPLFYANRNVRSQPVMMAMRLDAPDAAIVHRMIVDSLKAESDGLQGQICIDSRNIQAASGEGKVNEYGVYDQTLRNLAELVRTKTKMQMTFNEQKHDREDKSAVLAAGSVKNVALYIGWYNNNEYVPACAFNTGAVGFHVASGAMISLHHFRKNGWVAGMLKDGLAASLGPVNEPYLHAFPKADDFFPLLMTGKMPLAEVYWRTAPLVSWMIGAIGDPLYTPYKKNPPLAVEDLPPRLRGLIQGGGGSTRPAPPQIQETPPLAPAPGGTTM